VNPVVGRAVAQIADAQLTRQLEILAPALVMVALFHLVYPFGTVRSLDGGIAALNSGGENKALRSRVRLLLGLIVLHKV
jgi:hypothetical protein